MKIFAKRKRKVAAPVKESEGGSASDKIVEELLKNDPSTWNAKQRRLIKRYQQRKQTQKQFETSSGDQEDQEEATLESDPVDDSKKVEADADAQSDSDDSSSSSSSSSSSEATSESESEADSDAENQPKEQSTHENETHHKILDDDDDDDDQQQQESSNDEKIPSSGQAQDDSHTPPLQDLLEQLNSKQRRKLTRQLERGEADEATIRQQAFDLIHAPSRDPKAQSQSTENTTTNGTSGQETKGTKRDATNEESLQSDKKKKRRRKGGEVDWSKLPPEERFRREEQRRLQQEAAKRRAENTANGSSSPTYRHPLNSERRRANRRKPKHTNTAKSPRPRGTGNHHNASGYEMRKQQPYY